VAAVNYYLGMKRGADMKPVNVVIGTATAGTAVDVEVRIQINDGSNATNITRKDAIVILERIEQYINSGGFPSLGTDLPAL
jgi:hypothetical protein